MSLTQLTSQFIELERELHDAVRVNDDQRIRDVDMQIELCFAQLLECDASNAYERRAKCEFLIERLCPAESREGLDQLICSKIVELVAADDVVGLQKATAK